jgi:nitrogen regulatory protein PII
VKLALFINLLKESFRDLVPIVLVILFFQLAVIQAIPPNWISTSIGLFIVAIGLAIFLLGLEIGIFPVGEGLAKDFAKRGSSFWVLIFGFAIGFGTTIAEPALVVIAQKAAAISSGRIDANILRFVVAGSVGFAILLGVYRIIKGHPIHYYIIAGYVAVVSITFAAPKEIIGLAYDLGGVTTSTVTVPLVAALGIGLASNIKGRNPVIDGFGLIAFASLTPMIFVQVYGIAVYNFVEAKDVVVPILNEVEAIATTNVTLSSLVNGILGVIKDIIPIIAIILFFQYGVIKKNIQNLKTVFLGFIFVIIGLYAFILGLELGLFSLGESMAKELTATGSNWVIYTFGFAIGFATTMAEPALMAVAKKSKEISDGKINDFALRIFVAIGVAFGIALGAFRIIDGGHIHYYIIVGYMIVIALTFIAPKYIIPIAYDSGGVTTSTVTVPLVAALGIGLATNIDGRSALIDGFGLIAFASLFPMISVMGYGIISEKFNIKSDTQKENENIFEGSSNIDDSGFAHINIDGGTLLEKLNLSFSAVVVIVPQNKKEDALHAARDYGATGVTHFKAHGMGLNDMDNIFRFDAVESDEVLLFILPDSLVNKVLDGIIHRLHITSTGDGIAFSIPISNVKGISLRQKHTFEDEIKDEIKKNIQKDMN